MVGIEALEARVEAKVIDLPFGPGCLGSIRVAGDELLAICWPLPPSAIGPIRRLRSIALTTRPGRRADLVGSLSQMRPPPPPLRLKSRRNNSNGAWEATNRQGWGRRACIVILEEFSI